MNYGFSNPQIKFTCEFTDEINHTIHYKNYFFLKLSILHLTLIHILEKKKIVIFNSISLRVFSVTQYSYLFQIYRKSIRVVTKTLE